MTNIEKTLRPFMKLWSTAAKHELDGRPHPVEVASTHVPGVHSLRILIMGTGIAMGYGVLSHDLAVPGHLARQISAATGRGVDIDVLVDLEMTPDRCRERVHELNTSRYDAVVFAIGMWDTFTVASPVHWATSFTSLIDDLHSRTPVGQDIFVVTLPPVQTSRMLPSAPRWAIDMHADKLNAELTRIFGQNPAVTLLPLSDFHIDDCSSHTSSQIYQQIAACLAPTISCAFSDPYRPRLRMLDRIDEAHRQSALDRLAIVDTDPEQRFDRIVYLAQRMFGTTSAAISFIDGNRQWFKSKLGVKADETLRRDAFCAVTIATPGPLVVEDATLDVRFMDKPMVRDENHVRFYAGYPIEAPGGERVGAFCIFDSAPRQFAEEDLAALRSIAMLVQDELWAPRHLIPS